MNTYTDYGTLEGRCEWDEGNNTVVIRDSLTNEATDLAFPIPFDAIVYPHIAIGLRVALSGTITYIDGKPASLMVDSIRRLREQHELPQFGEGEAINITDGMDSAEYVRRMRDEW